MKKALSLILTLVLCLSLCACVGSKPITVEELAGTWTQSLWFFPTTLKLNSNGTFDYGEVRGTFTATKQGNVNLTPRLTDMRYTSYEYYGGYLYATTAYFEQDMEYGLSFTPDENGKTNQRFVMNLGEGLEFDPELEATSIEFTLRDDGTFEIFTSVFRYSSSLGSYFNDKPWNTYQGTYTYQNNILTLTYEGIAYPLVAKDGRIFYMTYSKHAMSHTNNSSSDVPNDAPSDDPSEAPSDVPVTFLTITLSNQSAANDVLEMWRKNGTTYENMKSLMDEYGADQGGGQLYELREPDMYLEEIATWCLDTSRKVGDVEIIKTDYGYAIVYIVSLNNG